jgi:predicted  nucleic acid-binding Zn-ribbon protein
MTQWQNLMDATDIEDSLEYGPDAMAAHASLPGEPAPGDSVSTSKPDDLSATHAPAMSDPSIYMPAEGLFPSILPGDIVYIPQENNEQLSYKKGVYLGRNKDNKHTARDWNSKSEVEVSLATLVRKTDCTAEEKQEAASLRTYQPLGGVEFQPRQYRKNHILSSQACDTLLFEASQLAHGEKEITGYDKGFVKPIFLNFAQRFSQRNFTNGVRLEDIVRMFYATATSEQSKDATSSDAMWKADAERSAALLMKVLIEIVEDQYNYDKDVVAELRSEQAQMIIRANEAVKLASGSYFRQSFTDRQSTFDDAEGNQLEIDSLALKALKSRVQDAATGQEQLPGFGDDDVRRIFRVFSQFLEASPLVGTSLVEDIVRGFRRCALSELTKDKALDRAQRNATVRRQEALLLSLLISVDARMQFELHGSAPRIRSRFTTILMEERARLSFSASRSEAISNPHGYTVLTEQPETSHNDELHAKEAVVERPPRELRCYSCQHTWISISGAELRDCPKCGSYSVFAESPRRTASPDPGVPNRASATGEEALGQYFSERTDKYMNLYRQQPIPKSTSDSQESLPNPWEHLHNPSNTSLPKVSQTPPRDPEPENVAKMCYTCRHRFARAANAKNSECPRCGSEFVFTDSPRVGALKVLLAVGTAEEYDPGPALHPLGIAPSHLFDLICDTENTAARLHELQDRNSKNTRDLSETVDQLFRLRVGFSRLAKLQESPEYRPSFERVRENVYVLCSSVRYTMNSALGTLSTPLNETQWLALSSSIRSAEHTDMLERSCWYKAAITGLLEHLDGFKGEGPLDIDTDIRLLLERQTTIRTLPPYDTLSVSSDRKGGSEASTLKTCFVCYNKVPYVSDTKLGICPTCGSWYRSDPEDPKDNIEVRRPEPGKQNTTSENPDPSQPQDQASTVQPLTRLTASTSRVLNILQILQMHHSRDSTIIPEITDDLQSLLTSFQKLSQLHDDPQYGPNFVELQEPIQVLCRSTQHTLDAMLQVLTAEPPSEETMLMQLTMLTMRMAAEEKVGLPERLRWYSASVLGLLNHLDGFPSAGRIFQWLGIDEKVRSLLERQEGNPGSRKAD